VTVGATRRVVAALAGRRSEEPRLAELAAATRRLRATSRRQRALSGLQAAQIRMLRLDFERMGSQLAALEVRFADAMSARGPIATYDVPAGASQDQGVDEVRAVLAEVRREHERIRVRFGVFGEDSTLR
jgi:hypothetical protein